MFHESNGTSDVPRTVDPNLAIWCVLQQKAFQYGSLKGGPDKSSPSASSLPSLSAVKEHTAEKTTLASQPSPIGGTMVLDGEDSESDSSVDSGGYDV